MFMMRDGKLKNWKGKVSFSTSPGVMYLSQKNMSLFIQRTNLGTSLLLKRTSIPILVVEEDLKHIMLMLKTTF